MATARVEPLRVQTGGCALWQTSRAESLRKANEAPVDKVIRKSDSSRGRTRNTEHVYPFPRSGNSAPFVVLARPLPLFFFSSFLNTTCRPFRNLSVLAIGVGATSESGAMHITLTNDGAFLTHVDITQQVHPRSDVASARRRT
jgi:hypothetical protein